MTQRDYEAWARDIVATHFPYLIQEENKWKPLEEDIIELCRQVRRETINECADVAEGGFITPLKISRGSSDIANVIRSLGEKKP